MSIAKDKVRILETILCSPGMTEKCKIHLTLSRQNILLLSRLIEHGMNANGEMSDDIISVLPSTSLEELKEVVPEILKKGGLSELHEKLKTL